MVFDLIRYFSFGRWNFSFSGIQNPLCCAATCTCVDSYHTYGSGKWADFGSIV